MYDAIGYFIPSSPGSDNSNATDLLPVPEVVKIMTGAFIRKGSVLLQSLINCVDSSSTNSNGCLYFTQMNGPASIEFYLTGGLV